MLNSSLVKSATRVMENTAPAQWTITAKFINATEGSTWKFVPFKINHILINRDYIVNYADEIDLEMLISPKDYALLQDQGQNLLCILTLSYVTKSGKKIFDPAPIQKQYHVMITDPRDIRTAVPDVHLHVEPSVTMTVRLMEPLIYKLRHVKINKIYQNCTLTEAIYGITADLGIEKIHLVELDNVCRYDHIDIASFQGIDTIYGYLHSKHGLYEAGANFYITGDVLYIYPPFQTAPVYDKTAIFYQVDQGRFAGSHVYHRVENNTVSIVINSQPESYDLSVSGSENVGTGFIFTRASRLTDGFTTIDSKEGAQFTENPALSVSFQKGRTAVKDQNNVFHIKATDNPYPTMAKILMHQASLMEVVWMNADPFQLDPGHAVAYYYDYNQKMVKKTGIVEKASFKISFIDKIDTRDLFGAVGKLELRLSPNVAVNL